MATINSLQKTYSIEDINIIILKAIPYTLLKIVLKTEQR